MALSLLMARPLPTWQLLRPENPGTSLPLSFIPNVGQSDPAVRYQLNGGSSAAFFMDEGLLLAVADGPETLPYIRVRWENANATVRVSAGQPLPGVVNYIRGNDPRQWQSSIPTFAEIIYQELYPGVDLHYAGDNGRLKGTYLVAPGSRPAQIRWRYEGAQQVSIDPRSGDLIIVLGSSDDVRSGPTIREAAPVAWQPHGSLDISVAVAYALHADGSVGFSLPDGYNANLPLVLDPTLTFSSYLGGALYDHGHAVTVDGEGNLYLKGVTRSANFPTHNPLFPLLKGDSDVFIAKLNADKSAYEFITYLGGSSSEDRLGVGGITLNAAGNIYLTGQTESNDFPILNAFQSEPVGINGVAYVTALTPSGSGLLFSTYLGGVDRSSGESIAIDWQGNIIIAGTAGSGFPLRLPLFVATGGIHPFVTKMKPGGQELVFSTYLGNTSCCGKGNGVAVDLAGDIYVTGETSVVDFPVTPGAFQVQHGGQADVFVTKIKSDGSALMYSTFAGGAGIDSAISVAVDGRNQVHVTGRTSSTNFPTANALQPNYGGGRSDAFVLKLDEAGSALLYSTYLGGNDDENFAGADGAIVLDEEGEAYVVGSTHSNNFPTLNPIQPTRAGNNDLFIVKLSAGGQLRYSTYLGGSNGDDDPFDAAVDFFEVVHVIGGTNSTNFPLKNALQTQNSGSMDVYIVSVADGVVMRPEIIPDYLSFPTQAVHETSTPSSVVILNRNEAELPLGGITIAGRHAGNFAVTEEDCTAAAIPAEEYCAIRIVFTPSGSGPRHARLELSSPVWNGPRIVGLHGVGAPSLLIEPDLLDFGFQRRNHTSIPHEVTLSNAGDTALPIGDITVTGLNATDFFIDTVLSNCANRQLPGGESCKLVLRFQPSQDGYLSAAVLIEAPFFETPARLPLQGMGGTQPNLTLTYFNEKDVQRMNACIGLAVTVKGSNFPFNPDQGLGQVQLFWGELPFGSPLFVDPDGSFTTTITVPDNPGGVTALSARDVNLSSAVAHAAIRSPRKNLPIILIPGVSGSELVASKSFSYRSPAKPWQILPAVGIWSVFQEVGNTYPLGTPVWLDEYAVEVLLMGNSRYLDPLRLEADGRTPMPDQQGIPASLSVGDILWKLEVDIPVIGGTIDLYHGLLTHLLDSGYVVGETLFPFPYDWRKDIDLTAEDLHTLVGQAQVASGQDQVVIVAHSMGGLVARNYLFTYGTNNVDQLITLGTPYLGAPKVAKVLEAGDNWGIGRHLGSTILGVGASPLQMQELARNFPTSYQLMPSRDWWSGNAWGNSSSYIVRHSTINFSLIREELGYAETAAWIGQRRNQQLMAQSLRWQNRGLGNLGLLTDTYYNQRIIGIGNDTLGHLNYSPYRVCARVDIPFLGPQISCLPLVELLLPKEDLMGDGTVPFHSAMGANFPAWDERYYQVSDTDHNLITSNPTALNYLSGILAGELCSVRQLPLTVQSTVSEESAAAIAAVAASPLGGMALAEAMAVALVPAAAETLEVTAIGTADLHIYDSAGNHVGLPQGAVFGHEINIPGASFSSSGIPGPGVQVARLTHNDTFTITLSSRIPDGVASLRLTYYDGDQAQTFQLFQAIPMTTTTTATVVLPGLALANTPPLSLKWADDIPAVSVPLQGTFTGDQAQNPDLVPPIAGIEVSTAGVATLTAVDNPGGSGVAAIFYSLDPAAGDHSFVTYTGPFRLPAGPVTLTAMAMDNAGNGQYSATLWQGQGPAEEIRIFLPLITR
jgi:pimeloyl-ACP methyl ester carboxylesterase